VPSPALVKAPNLEVTTDELRVARVLYQRGNEVVLRAPAESAVGGGSSDLFVNGRRWDIFAPKTKSADRIVSALVTWRGQSPADGVVLDLTQTCVVAADLVGLEARLIGLGAAPGDIIVIP
jgi:hypothetical protein